ncbi:phage holin family protein [Aurantiacibacter aquimixticola]|uniref:phage holin family protein n=1 Tax=Aurantiacibacter aquimixticola TaxID=1958945 RepID=UPI0014041CB7|nr:phage holin family protein [Aurantiacibacter aquimixticola]
MRPPDDGTVSLPDPPDDASSTIAEDDVAPEVRHSLFDDIEALIDDARTYVSAELTYQKTRAGFVTDRVKKGIAFGAVAVFCGVLATIGLTVGLIIALTPLVTAWGATAIVVLAWLLFAFLLARRAARNFSEASAAMNESDET